MTGEEGGGSSQHLLPQPDLLSLWADIPAPLSSPPPLGLMVQGLDSAVMNPLGEPGGEGGKPLPHAPALP